MMQSRVLALAGLLQALKQVRRIADTGQADASVLQTALDSVFRIDADSPQAVYGDVESLRPGLRLLRDYFGNTNKDEILPRLALAVMQLERRFVRDGAMAQQVHEGIVSNSDNAQANGSTHPDVLTALGALYAQTISHLRPKIMVQGNPHYLGQADIVSEIRALLLAAVRSAVLWRQMGGSFWDFLFNRKAMVREIDALLG